MVERNLLDFAVAMGNAAVCSPFSSVSNALDPKRGGSSSYGSIQGVHGESRVSQTSFGELGVKRPQQPSPSAAVAFCCQDGRDGDASRW